MRKYWFFGWFAIAFGWSTESMWYTTNKKGIRVNHIIGLERSDHETGRVYSLCLLKLKLSFYQGERSPK